MQNHFSRVAGPMFAALSALIVMAVPTRAQTPATAPVAATAANAKQAAAPTKLTINDRKLGDGPAAAAGEPVLVHYTGYLYDPAAPANKGAKFDSSLERPAPLGFIIGAGRVIKGWDEGIIGMKVGGQRTLVIPPDKAYGEQGAGALIPPNSTLVFDVELMGIIGKTQSPNANASAYVPGKGEAKK
jgi:FKBP-type peptidyl-prolyl cis-trans isomerase FkpA